MKCEFRTIDRVGDDFVHECPRCGYRVQHHYPPEKIYRECDALAPYGVGDAIALFTEWAGIAAWWHKKTAPKGGCGCAKRQAKLNWALPFPAFVRRLWATGVVWWITESAGRRGSS